MSSGMQIGLQWSINRNIPSSNGIKNLKGCVFLTRGLDSSSLTDACLSLNPEAISPHLEPGMCVGCVTPITNAELQDDRQFTKTNAEVDLVEVNYLLKY